MTIFKVTWSTCNQSALIGGTYLVSHDRLFQTKDAATKFSASLTEAAKLLEGGLSGVPTVTDITVT